ncbi:hypothetical protein, conserved [Eimeria tenella]|uniref:Uncharacterized protein n=1 Tax=Eimeria tenella TaxID=5802 RepID=H9B9L2_EIMTE|nr:hypothetical protein, conserved [Eimeria tenella]AET50672.1 hypothetical protein [Eimeria tenella]CDJ43347.1 hypothetical protein, conserved [Eimeria tenella]|eukprot:XP_013234097.1 hypothetical protein, conserved [Eimeria tenella]
MVLFAPAKLKYSDVSPHSLRAVSLEHGPQYSAIYWETGHRSWLPFWAAATQKFTWKLIDDQLRGLLRMTLAVSREPFVFYSSPRSYFRNYFGDPDVHLVSPLAAKFRFSFNAAGVEAFEDLDELLQQQLLQQQQCSSSSSAAAASHFFASEKDKTDAIDAIRKSAKIAEQP